MGVFIALIVVVGLLLIMLPNVEMVTATIFLAGYLFGVRKGLIIGMIAELIYSMLNPFGAPNPPLLIAQVVSMGIIGSAGGLFYTPNSRTESAILRSIQFGIVGCLLTMMFDFLTTVSFAIFMAETWKKIMASIITNYSIGFPFYIVHMGVNTLIFAMVLPLILKALTRLERFKIRLKHLIIAILFMLPLNANASHYVVPDSSVVPVQARSDSLITGLQDSLRVAHEDTVAIDSAITERIHIFEFDTSRTGPAAEALWSYSKKEIQTTIYEFPGELFSQLPGIHHLDRRYPGQTSTIMLNGLEQRDIHIRIDGRPMTNPFTDEIDLNMIPVESMSSVRITPDHAIDLTMERYHFKRPHTSVYFHKGPSKFSDTDVGFGQQFTTKTDAMLGFTLKGFSGPLESESLVQHNARAKIHYRYSPRWRLYYIWLYNRIKLHEFGSKDEAGVYATPDAHSTRVRHDHTLTVKGSVWNSHYQNFISRLYVTSLFDKYKDKTAGIKDDDRSYYTGISSELNKALGSNHLKFTSDLRVIWMNDKSRNRDRIARYRLGVSDNVKVTDNLSLNADIGLDGQSASGMKMTGSASLSHHFADFLRLSAGAIQSVRHPSLFEMNGDYGFIGNPDLEATTIRAMHAGFDLQPHRSIHVTSTLFFQRMTDAIDYRSNSDSTASFINTNRPAFSGVNAKLVISPGLNIRISGDISYLSEDDIQAPQMTAGGYLQYENSFFKEDLNIDLRFNIRQWGERTSHEYPSYGFIPYSRELPDAWIISANAYIKIMGAIKTYIGIENILDEKYQIVYGYPMIGRTIHYGLRWEFHD
jgi:outer membrane cobalamin receptor/uncharacterized membrane protein